MKIAVSRLITAAISLVAVITMFVGATFAWFNAYDNANKANNSFSVEAASTPDLLISSDDDAFANLTSFFSGAQALPEASDKSTPTSRITSASQAEVDTSGTNHQPLKETIYLLNTSSQAITNVTLTITITTSDFDKLKNVVCIGVSKGDDTTFIAPSGKSAGAVSLLEMGFESETNSVTIPISLTSFENYSSAINVYMWLDGTETDSLETTGSIGVEFVFSKAS